MCLSYLTISNIHKFSKKSFQKLLIEPFISPFSVSLPKIKQKFKIGTTFPGVFEAAGDPKLLHLFLQYTLLRRG